MIFEGELTGMTPKKPANGERFIELKIAIPYTLRSLTELGKYFGSTVQAEIAVTQNPLFEEGEKD